uniref:DUF1977 domain-containing protein n=1 Tax=Xiphophorus couchianus TaxID=32473 RepID=A0A3B5MGN5_9TELE
MFQGATTTAPTSQQTVNVTEQVATTQTSPQNFSATTNVPTVLQGNITSKAATMLNGNDTTTMEAIINSNITTTDATATPVTENVTTPASITMLHDNTTTTVAATVLNDNKTTAASKASISNTTVTAAGTAAFDAIGNAYAVLSNPEKRQQYDQYGEQSPTSNVPHRSGNSRPGHYRNFYRDFEADISPEELFNIFFGGRFPTGNVHVYTNQGASYSQFYQPRRRRAQERREEVVEENQSQNTFTALLQLLPVLVLILISVFTQMMATNPPYSLFYKPAMGLVVSRETQHMGVPYYVDKSFQKEYRGAALEELEKSIESDYIEHLQSSCWKEKQQKSDLANLGQLYRDERLKQKAESMRLDNCEKLQRLVGRLRVK